MAPVYQKNVKYTLASHAVERLRPSDDAINLMQKMSDGKISADDAVNQLLKKYGVSQGSAMAESFSRYDVYTVTGSIYCYRDTNVLRNRLGIRDNQQLRIVEADITAVRQNDLLETPILGRFTSNHLCRIHKYLFGDVYSFAGHFRKEDIMKGTTRFLSHKEIGPKLSALLKKLKDENYLRNLSAEKLTSRSAFYLAELNYIHPFREGNGRSIREFMRLLYVQAGYDVHWDAVEPEVLLQAMEESVYRTAMLEAVLAECLKKKI